LVWRSPDWLRWAALLAGLYLLSASLARHRLLINTEVWALYHAGRPLFEQLAAVREDLVHPPLFYLLERAWLRIFGATDGSAKLLPVLVNIPALFLFTWLARRVTSRWRVASLLFAGAYLAPGQTLTLVRMYGLVILWVLVALVLWDEWRKQPGGLALTLWAAAVTLLVYTHYSGLLIVAGFLAVNWLFGPRRLLFSAACAVPLAAFLPWAAFEFPVYEARGLETNLWWVRMLLAEPYKGLGLMMYEFLGPMPVEGRWRYLFAACAGALHIVLLVFAARSLGRLWPRRRDAEEADRRFWILAVFAGVPVVALLVFSMAATPALAPRFLIGILPAYWLLVVRLAELGGRRGLRWLYGAIVPWVLVADTSAVIRNLKPPALRAQIELAAQQISSGDAVVCLDELCNPIYWELRHRWGLRVPIEAPRPTLTPELSVHERRALEQGERLSVVPYRDIGQIDFQAARRIFVFHQGAAPDPAVAAELERRGFRLQRREASGPHRLSIYDRSG
jgi:hypothetical protein